MKAPFREKSGKKLIWFTVGIFLLIALVVFLAMTVISSSVRLGLMDQYLREVPKIVDARAAEMTMRSRIYENDVTARAELGMKLYEENDGLADAERLEKVRSVVSADSVTLTDGRGNVLATTGPAAPEELFRARLESLEPRVPALELYPARDANGEETGKRDGKGFVLLPVAENPKRGLVFEFSCEPMLEVYNAIGDWPSVLERLLSGTDGLAFVQTDDGNVVGYPLEGLTQEQTVQLYDKVGKVFADRGSFLHIGSKAPCKLITLQGKHYFAARMQYPEQNADLLLAAPFKDSVGTILYSAVLIAALAGLGLVLLQLYAFRRVLREKPAAEGEKPTRSQIRFALLPGIIIVLIVTGCVSDMTVQLEDRSTTAYVAMTKRETAQHEIDWHKKQEDTIRRSYGDIYRTRAKVLADFLTEHPDRKTRAGLRELTDLARADYVMLLDQYGQERLSSNSYTGFSVGTNLSEEYRAVLLGYPYAVAEPSADPYTGEVQIGAAILMTDEEGLPDGFLLAVFDADDLKTELEGVNIENTVNSFAVQEGHMAVLINEADKCFLAHTDPGMIGRKAEEVLVIPDPGSNFEGFTTYNGKNVYVSGHVSDGRSLMFIVPESMGREVKLISFLLILAILLIQGLVYYPTASVLCVEAMQAAKEKRALGARPLRSNPATVFADGYVIFFSMLMLLAWLVSSKGRWPAFHFVFSGQWSKGVHLFSIWAALFIISVTLFAAFIIRSSISLVESRLSLRAKTITRLVDSLISYTSGIFLIFYILTMFGVNTAALLASAGIVSIAVGMGAQSMASDILAGFFMMLEGSVRVGDRVRVNGIVGHVTDMGIRTTEITDDDGNVVIFNNSQVNGVINMSRAKQAQETESMTPQQ